MGSLLLIAVLTLSMGCSSMSEDADVMEGTNEFYSNLISGLENLDWAGSSSENARSTNKIPSFLVTIRAIQAFDVMLPAVKDRATVLIATDEAYAKLGIYPHNVGEFPFMMGIIANQVVTGQTILGKALAGNTYFNMLEQPLTFSEENGVISVLDVFGNHANIIRTDWKALNSTNHFIDSVLLPSFD